VVEKHFGLPMGWFFNQWVYGTAIPTYTFSWRSEPAADGQHLLRIRVRQEDVPGDFVMPIPLLIEFPGGSRAFVRVTVRGEVTEAKLTLSQQPSRLELNPYESVLAEVKETRWR
jgi:aminopeptidase N